MSPSLQLYIVIITSEMNVKKRREGINDALAILEDYKLEETNVLHKVLTDAIVKARSLA